MKKSTLIILASVLFFISCKKEGTTVIDNKIIGRWELARTMSYSANVSFPTGNGETIKFESLGKFSRSKFDTLLFSGFYQLRTKKDCYKRDDNTILETNETDASDFSYVTIENGMLVLNMPNCYMDGGGRYYRKIE